MCSDNSGTPERVTALGVRFEPGVVAGRIDHEFQTLGRPPL